MFPCYHIENIALYSQIEGRELGISTIPEHIFYKHYTFDLIKGKLLSYVGWISPLCLPAISKIHDLNWRLSTCNSEGTLINSLKNLIFYVMHTDDFD